MFVTFEMYLHCYFEMTFNNLQVTTCDRLIFWKYAPLLGFTRRQPWCPATPPAHLNFADDASLKLILSWSNLYWNDCSAFTDGKYTIAFQIYTRITEILMWIHLQRKWLMFKLYAHAHKYHVTRRSSGSQRLWWRNSSDVLQQTWHRSGRAFGPPDQPVRYVIAAENTYVFGQNTPKFFMEWTWNGLDLVK